MGSWNQGNARPIPGWFCAVVAWPHYASNILMLLAPVCFWIPRRWNRARWLYIFFAVFFALSGIGALFWLPTLKTVHIGFVLWATSFFLASMAGLLGRLTCPAHCDHGSS
jgi:hypothetical protein